jgi:hypothetical protein
MGKVRMPARLEEALHRRMELCRAGFAYDVAQAVRYRGRLELTDERVDGLEPWKQVLRRWLASRPRRTALSRKGFHHRRTR